METILRFGVNHIDTSANYGDSELKLGPWMATHRKDFFLATKVGERTYASARAEFHRSLERLRVDSVDLLQMHNLVDPEQWEIAMGPGGALEALIEAKEQGLTRFIGVSGHGLAAPVMHLKSLVRYDLDTVLLPFNYVLAQNPTYAADFRALRDTCIERGVAIQTIKSLARGPLGDLPKRKDVWYDPIEEQQSIDRAVAYVLGQPDIFLNTTGDVTLLPRVLDAASRYTQPPTDEMMAELAREEGMTPLFT